MVRITGILSLGLFIVSSALASNENSNWKEVWIYESYPEYDYPSGPSIDIDSAGNIQVYCELHLLCAQLSPDGKEELRNAVSSFSGVPDSGGRSLHSQSIDTISFIGADRSGDILVAGPSKNNPHLIELDKYRPPGRLLWTSEYQLTIGAKYSIGLSQNGEFFILSILEPPGIVPETVVLTKFDRYGKSVFQTTPDTSEGWTDENAVVGANGDAIVCKSTKDHKGMIRHYSHSSSPDWTTEYDNGLANILHWKVSPAGNYYNVKYDFGGHLSVLMADPLGKLSVHQVPDYRLDTFLEDMALEKTGCLIVAGYSTTNGDPQFSCGSGMSPANCTYSRLYVSKICPEKGLSKGPVRL